MLKRKSPRYEIQIGNVNIKHFKLEISTLSTLNIWVVFGYRIENVALKSDHKIYL